MRTRMSAELVGYSVQSDVMARPRKYSNERILDALTKTRGMVYLAADKLGCDADTIYNRAKVTPAIAERMKHERGKVGDTAELKLHTAILNGEPWAIQFWLRMQAKDRGYVERIEQRHGGDPESPLPAPQVVLYLPDNGRDGQRMESRKT
jgi:hypothetical protein